MVECKHRYIANGNGISTCEHCEKAVFTTQPDFQSGCGSLTRPSYPLHNQRTFICSHVKTPCTFIEDDHFHVIIQCHKCKIAWTLDGDNS